jgi:cytochrome c oxidase accessory protein FixG
MSRSFTLPQIEERVLSTLNADGSRRWMDPREVNGAWHRRRELVAWSLIAVFTSLPWLRIGGKPPILLDLMTRHFTFFGTTFRPTETALVAVVMAIVFVTVFLVTAVAGRVWCGWGCPQTVYLEFVYRPLERLIARKGAPAWRRIAVYGAFLLVSAHLANTFLAYFVGTDRLMVWTWRNPAEHPTAFAVFAVVTGLMMFDFAFFREQLCTLVCPYGRFQSALLDRDSLIVAYDRGRGEPRGGVAAQRAARERGERVGDCVDCSWCVQVCPTGIDIRQGLQMECLHCTQCIDACDAVMAKTGRAPGLVRYASQRSIDGAVRTGMRWRVALYSALLVGFVALLAGLLAGRRATLAEQVRLPGVNFSERADGRVETPVRLLVENRSDVARTYRLEGVGDVELSVPVAGVAVEPAEMATVNVVVVTPISGFVRGSRSGALRVIDDTGVVCDVHLSIAGPFTGTGAKP